MYCDDIARVGFCKFRSHTGNIVQNSAKETVGLCKKLRLKWPRTVNAENSSFIKTTVTRNKPCTSDIQCLFDIFVCICRSIDAVIPLTRRLSSK